MKVKADLYRYLNFNEIENFEDFGRVIRRKSNA